MATTEYDFSHAANFNLKGYAGMVFDAVLKFTRDDSETVDFTDIDLVFEVKNEWETTPLCQWEVETEFTVVTNELTFDIIPQDSNDVNLEARIYKYVLYDSENNQAVAYGQFQLL